MEETGPKTHPASLKHKPSPRHTLEEVLRSLQDMVRNELGAAGQHPPGAAPEAAVPPTGATPRDIETGLRTVLETLDGEESHIPIADEEPPEHMPDDSAPFELEPSPPPAPQIEPPEPVIARPELAPSGPAVERAAQHDLPLAEPRVADPEPAMLDEPPRPALDEQPPIEDVSLAEPEPAMIDETPFIPINEDSPAADESPIDEELIDIEFTDMDDDEPETEDATMRETDAPREAEPIEEIPKTGPDTTAASEEEMPPETDAPETDADDIQFVDTGAVPEPPDWEDVPVLEDAVYVPPESHPDSEPGKPAIAPDAGEPSAPVQLEVPLPSPEGAREIAIRAAARLNIELKRSGRRGLSNDVIIQLTRILRDSLAQAGANVDNTSQKK